MRMSSTISTMALALILGASTAAAQECPWWCEVLWEGTEIVGHGCQSSPTGLWAVWDCTVHNGEVCEGEMCVEQTEELPDLTVVAVVRSCGGATGESQVIADLWRDFREPAAVLAEMPMKQEKVNPQPNALK